jgi:hypothetical protein
MLQRLAAVTPQDASLMTNGNKDTQSSTTTNLLGQLAGAVNIGTGLFGGGGTNGTGLLGALKNF